uniref:Uncharacterized protein n=1 Tax=Schlesneria paludicola TaxID=360056 RepID=A0A7C4LQ25_9PLAN
MKKPWTLTWTVAAYALLASTGWSADLYKLPAGTPEIQSLGPLAFGPDGLLLMGDPKAAAVIAIQTGDKSGNPQTARYHVENLAGKIAEVLQADPQTLSVRDLAVNPLSGNVYVSLAVGTQPALVRINTDGTVQRVVLQNIPFSRATLPNPPEDKVVGEGRRARNLRESSITDLAWVDGQVIVSGLSGAPAPSNVRALGFPFSEANAGANLEIYHAAHGRSEDFAAVRTFVPFVIDGKPNLLAGFTCTPLVQIPVEGLEPGEKVRGKTVAELGNMNTPLDMIVYKKNDQTYLLMANDRRGVMKISTADIEKNQGLSQPVRGGGTAGQPYETISDLQNVVQLDKLNEEQAVVLIQDGSSLTLKSIPLP